MPRRCRHAIFLPLCGAAAIALSATMPAGAAAINPDQIAYDAKVNEDPAAKACMLELLLKRNGAGETVKFALVVARMKREDALAGPLVFGFSIDVRDPQYVGDRPSAPRPVEISSAALTPGRVTVAPDGCRSRPRAG